VHPNRAFHWDDQAAIREFVRAIGFGAMFAATPKGPRVAHAPAVWLGKATLGLHIARGNGLTPHLDGATALFAVQGPDGYVSPDWYGLGGDQVPTWNYVSVELEGSAQLMDEDALVVQLDQLAAEQEALLAPKRPWTRDKMDDARFRAMLKGIVGVRLDITHWRGTLKLGQTKPAAVRIAAADGVAASGRVALADWMRR
jgi:transcriptional regulator